MAAAARAFTFSEGYFNYTTAGTVNGEQVVTLNGFTSTAASYNFPAIEIPGHVSYGGTLYRVSEIAESAFAVNKNLVTVNINYGVERVKAYAFQNCEKLKYLRLPSSITVLEKGSFQGTILEQIAYAGVKYPTTYQNTFDTYHKSSPKVYVNNGTALAALKADYYGWAQHFQSIERNGSIAYDFADQGHCYRVTKGTPYSFSTASCELVGRTAGITTITLGQRVNFNDSGASVNYHIDGVADSAFMNNDLVYELKNDYSLAGHIGTRAFYGCKKLVKADIACDSIGNYAFYNCSSLASVTMHAPNDGGGAGGVKYIGFMPFGNTALTTVKIPSSVKAIGNAPFYNCSKLTSITVDANNSYFSSYNDILYDKLQTVVYQVPCGKKASAFGAYASVFTPTTERLLYYCAAGSLLTGIDLPYGVNLIENYAFANCAYLESVKIPSSATSIRTTAFSGCSAIRFAYLNLATVPTFNLFPDATPSKVDLYMRWGTYNAYYSSSIYYNYNRQILTDSHKECWDINKDGYYYTVVSTTSHTGFDNTTMAGELEVVKSATTVSSIPNTATYNGKKFEVTMIGYRAFYNSSISKLGSNMSVKTIMENAFEGAAITSFPFHRLRLEEIGANAFLNCTKLSDEITLDAIKSIGSKAFYNSAIYKITTGKNLQTVGADAFNKCGSLTEWFMESRGAVVSNSPYTSGNMSSLFKHWVDYSDYDTYAAVIGSTNATRMNPYVNVTSNYQTFAFSHAVDFVSASGAPKFYTVSSVDLNKGKAQLDPVSVAPASTGLVIQATSINQTGYKKLKFVSSAPSVTSVLTGVYNTNFYCPANTTYNHYAINPSKPQFDIMSGGDVVKSGGAYLYYLKSKTSGISTIHTSLQPDEEEVIEYPLSVTGVRITSKNCNNITAAIKDATGTITYNASTNTLTLNNATIDMTGDNLGTNAIKYDYRAKTGFKIELDGDNKIISKKNIIQINIGESMDFAILGYGSLTTDGTLYLDALSSYQNECTMSYFTDCTLNIDQVMSEDYEEGLTLNNVELNTNYLNVGSDHNGQKGLTLQNCYIAYPTNGTIKNGEVCVNGNYYHDRVEIKRGQPTPSFEKGDVNGDGIVNGGDVTALYNYLLNNEAVNGNADVNDDGNINGTDVTALYNLLLE